MFNTSPESARSERDKQIKIFVSKTTLNAK